jgi:hypothetical protein
VRQVARLHHIAIAKLAGRAKRSVPATAPMAGTARRAPLAREGPPYDAGSGGAMPSVAQNGGAICAISSGASRSTVGIPIVRSNGISA